MRSRLLSLLSLALVPLSLQAAVANRIAAVDGSATVAMHGNIHPKALAAQDQGEAPSGQMLDSLTIRFSLTATQQAALDQLLADQQDPSSPRYRQWLTPEQFGAQFGLSSGDLAKVTTWLKGQGFNVTGVGRSSTFVTFTGTVATVERAFHTSIHSLALDGEQHIGNLTEPELPASIASVTTAITGLSDFKVKSRAQVRTIAPDAAVHPQYTSSVSGDHYIAPGDFYTIYDVNPLLNSAINGTGITIAVLGQTDISLSDVAAFRTASGLSASNVPTVKLYGTDPGTSTNDLDEAQLDVEWSGAVAPSASILYVNSKDVFDTSMVQAVDNNLAPIITVSYGNCETGFGTTALNSFNQLFQQANAQGITVLGPGGDSGATDCDYHVTIATGGLAVDFPASSPFVTGVGGTMFNEGSSSAYFGATNGTYSGSALSYVPEAVWNETGVAGASDLSAGGGGASIFFTKPTWQTGTGVPADSSRDVPDISMDAAYIHDPFLFCASGFCTNGFRNSSGYLDAIGGTSVSTPAFSGILALLEQKIGKRIGNANPTLYALANSTYYGSVFHDITTGNNKSPCRAGSPNCASGGSIGYSAGTGYDQASGWGSIDAYNLATDWTLTSGGGGTTTTSAVSTTTLALQIGTTLTPCGAVSGSTYTFTVTVAGSSGTPTGSVQFSVDNTNVGTAVLLTGGTATYTLATTGLSSGSHVVTASYSGDTTYASSKGSYTVDLTSANQGDFSLTPCTASVSVASGQAATPVTYTLTSLNGFTGPVNFTVSTGSSSLAAGYSFSVTPVTLTSGGTGTTALTIYAYQKTGSSAITPITTVKNTPADVPWYVAGSGVTIAGLLLLMAPRRRRWPALFAVLLTCAVLGAVGCSTATTTSPGTTTTATTTNATPGTYSLTVAASGTNSSGTALVHNVTISLTVQ